MKYFHIVLIFTFYFPIVCKGQKPVLDLDSPCMQTRWPAVAFRAISNNGKYLLYTLTNFPRGSNTLVAQSIDGAWKVQYANANWGTITEDSKQAFFKMSNDSLCCIKLGTNEVRYIPHVLSFSIGGENATEWLLYLEGGSKKTLFIQNLKTGEEKRIEDVNDYTLNKQGTILLFLSKNTTVNQQSILHWENLLTGADRPIWKGERAYNFVFDTKGDQLAFFVETSEQDRKIKLIYNYKEDLDSANKIATDENLNIDSNLVISDQTVWFSQDGKRLFFHLVEKPFPESRSSDVKVDIWNYRDQPLQSWQVIDKYPKEYTAVLTVESKQIKRLQLQNEELLFSHAMNDDCAIAYGLNSDEGWWNKAVTSNIYLVSTIDGSRKVFKNKINYVSNQDEFNFSPDGKWLLYFDRVKKSWYSYEYKTGIFRNITQKILYPIYNENWANYPEVHLHNILAPVGITGWLSDGQSVLIYDDYDIWQVDLFGLKTPINITNGFGRLNHIKFRVTECERGAEPYLNDTILLSAFNVNNKYNGFYKTSISTHANPEKLYMGPYILYAQRTQLFAFSSSNNTFLTKGRDGGPWVLTRRSATEAPNLIATNDFKAYKVLTNFQPQGKYNWLTSELVQWKMLDGKRGTGILYKPENFDAQKKYPVIFTYYEQRSNNLYDYPIPHMSYAEINIPYYVSRGYLVFEPDIYYETGHPVKSVLNSVVSAARYLSKLPFVDSVRLGIQGHSFGGSETNFLITHTNLFAAAAEASGGSDMISDYNSLRFGFNGDGAGNQFQYELNQYRIGATLWSHPELYIENSPILSANHVTTPLLIMHNKKDESVPFSQGVELFMALRRLGKKVWLLQYDEGGHVIGRAQDQRDFTIRMEQFFNYYLKDALPPIWMTEGIPAKWKGIHTGYELDRSGKKP